MTGDDVAQQLEHEANELEHHLDALEDHISDAQKSAAHLREQTNPETVGDFEDTRGTPGGGDDPEGASKRAPGDEAQTSAPEDSAAAAPQASGGDADDADRGDSAADDSGDDDASSSDDDDTPGGVTPGHASGGDD